MKNYFYYSIFILIIFIYHNINKSETITSVPDFITVKGGTYIIGDTFGDGNSNERPFHSVKISSFMIGKYEVTQKEWKDVIGNNPSFFSGDNLPIENVSWKETILFCNKKSKKDGLTPCYIITDSSIKFDLKATGYRLPTEAEWEYAAKGGELSYGFIFSGSNNVLEVAWYKNNSINRTNFVGLKTPNELGIYDMSGNVWEWCWDWYGNYYISDIQVNPLGPLSGSKRVRRGGGWWSSTSEEVRNTKRYGVDPAYRSNVMGFRLAKSIL